MNPKKEPVRRTKSTSPAKRVKARPAEEAALAHEDRFNPGQLHLLIDLLREFSGTVEARTRGKAENLELDLSSEMPGLEAFLQFKLAALKADQDALAALYRK